jgi:imidazolonepropionase-like amidohydrolase
MRFRTVRSGRTTLCLCVLLCAGIAFCAQTSAAQVTLAIRGAKVYPISGPPIERGVLLVANGKIVAVGEEGKIKIPRGATIEDAAGKVVMPGIVDSHSHIGIIANPMAEDSGDANESTGPIQPGLRALDAIDPADPNIRMATAGGVTTANIMPGSGNVIDTYGKKDKAPATRMKTAEIIRHALADAKAYEEKSDKWKKEGSDISKQPSRDMKLEALLPVVDGKLPAIFNAYRADDIDTAIRIGNEFHLRYMLASVTEGYLISDTIQRAGVPCLLGPVMQRFESLETANATFENPAILKRAGIPIALMTGLEEYVPKNRILLFEAGIAAANGLGMEGALRAATADAAKILAIDDRVGSLAPGKDADVVLFDGDPFEYTSHVLAVLVGGQVSYQRSK